MTSLGELVSYLPLAAVCAVMFLRSFGPVSRRRVERFASRQQLEITSGNGDLVIRYLATTRRWRSAGLATGLLASVVYGVSRGTSSADVPAEFIGWFLGAVVAEWRLSGIDPGANRAALLVPRRRSDYLSRPARIMTDATLAIMFGAGLTDIAWTVLDGAPVSAPHVALLLLAAAVVVIVALVQRRLLARPQPVAARDLLAADDAIRSRSLHVLTGSALAVVTPLLVPLALDLVTGWPSAFAGVVTAAYFIGPFAGWLIATGRPPVGRAVAGQRMRAVGAPR
jgi:hypothetical protein